MMGNEWTAQVMTGGGHSGLEPPNALDRSGQIMCQTSRSLANNSKNRFPGGPMLRLMIVKGFDRLPIVVYR